MLLKHSSCYSERKIRALAAIGAIVMVGLIGLLAFAIYGGHRQFDTGLIALTMACVIVGLLFLLLVCFVVVRLYSRVYSVLFGGASRAGRMKGSWIINTGSAPQADRVNVEYKNSSISWNRTPETLDWRLDNVNPIVSYLPTRNRQSTK